MDHFIKRKKDKYIKFPHSLDLFCHSTVISIMGLLISTIQILSFPFLFVSLLFSVLPCIYYVELINWQAR